MSGLLLPRSRAPHLMLPAASLVLLAALALVLKSLPTAGLEGYQQRMRPELILGQDKITQRNAAFLRAGLLKMSHTFCEPDMLASDSSAAVKLYGQVCPPPDPVRLQQDLPPSTALLPPVDAAVPEEVTVVSIVCRSDHLFDEDHGIVTNPEARGKLSERPAWLSARLGSKILIESPIGLRIHGGHSRGMPYKSFSLLFREEYGGFKKCPPGLFFGPDTPAASHIVLMNAAHPSRFNGALATEIAGLLGCKTSRSTPAMVYLNGTLIQSPFFLYQHQSPEFVKDHFGLADVYWSRLKDKRQDGPSIKWRKRKRENQPVRSLQDEGYDLADISAWALTMSFTSTTDCDQGGYFQERFDPEAVCQSLVWDMDCAFNDDRIKTENGVFVYAGDPFKVLIGDRARLFFRLMEQSPEYRSYFERFAHEMLTTKLPEEKLSELADRYLQLARTHPASNPRLVSVMEDTQAFLATRREDFVPYLRRKLDEAGGAKLLLSESE